MLIKNKQNPLKEHKDGKMMFTKDEPLVKYIYFLLFVLFSSFCRSSPLSLSVWVWRCMARRGQRSTPGVIIRNVGVTWLLRHGSSLPGVNGWLANPRNLPGSLSPDQNTNLPPCLAFYVGVEDWPQLLMFVWQALHRLSCLHSSPHPFLSVCFF